GVGEATDVEALAQLFQAGVRIRLARGVERGAGGEGIVHGLASSWGLLPIMRAVGLRCRQRRRFAEKATGRRGRPVAVMRTGRWPPTCRWRHPAADCRS